MGIHHSPHTHTIPIPMGIPMGIPIPTAALCTTLALLFGLLTENWRIYYSFHEKRFLFSS